VWRVKLIAELDPSVVSETEVARIEGNDFAAPETVGLTLDEGKRLMAATETEIVHAQVSTMGERFRWCEPCGVVHRTVNDPAHPIMNWLLPE
jgi:hypothetical protein